MKKSSSLPKEITVKMAEFILHQRTIYWFIAVFLLFSALLALAVGNRDYLLATIVLLGAAVFYQMALVRPAPTELKINPSGLYFRKKFHSWNEFRSFSVFENQSLAWLRLENRSAFAGPLTINLPKSKLDPALLRAVRSVLPEKLHTRQTVVELLARLIKF